MEGFSTMLAPVPFTASTLADVIEKPSRKFLREAEVELRPNTTYYLIEACLVSSAQLPTAQLHTLWTPKGILFYATNSGSEPSPSAEPRILLLATHQGPDYFTDVRRPHVHLVRSWPDIGDPMRSLTARVRAQLPSGFRRQARPRGRCGPVATVAPAWKRYRIFGRVPLAAILDEFES